MSKNDFRKGREEKGYYRYMHDRYIELLNSGEREEYSSELAGLPAIPDFEFADHHDFKSFLDYHGEVKGRTIYDYRKQAYSCLICRVCNSITCFRQTSARYGLVCPSGDRFRYDNYFGHGKLQMIRGFLDGELSHPYPPEGEPLRPLFEPTERFLHVVYTCTLCGGCESLCKIQKLLEPMHAAVALREYLVEQGIGPLPEHRVVLKNMENYDNPWGGARSARTRWLPRNRKVKVLGNGRERAEVLFYVGCTTAYVGFLKKVPLSIVDILQKADVDFGILGNSEICCGSTMLRLGDRRGFERFKSRNIEMFNSLGVETIVTGCAGCTSTFKEDYADELNCQIYHITEFLEKLLQEGKLRMKKEVPLRLTYHDPCHLGRYCGIYEEPRTLLKAIPGVKLVEMERIREDAYCCGAGGGVRTAFPDFSLWVARRRITEALETTGCNIVVTACPFCEQNLADAGNLEGVKVMDISEIVRLSIE